MHAFGGGVGLGDTGKSGGTGDPGAAEIQLLAEIGNLSRNT